MSEKKKIEIVFIIQGQERGQKDIDHYLPFLYFLSKSENLNYTAKGIIFDSKINFSKYIDARFTSLSELKNIELEFLYEENLLDKIKKLLKFKSNLKLVNFLNKLINKIFTNLSKFKNKNINWKKKLGENFLYSNLPFIFTTNGNSNELNFVSHFKKLNIKTKWIVLPHGTIVCDNTMVLETDLDKNEKIKHEKTIEEIDYFLKTSKRDKENEVSRGAKTDKTFVIGSPRYCKEWIEIKSNLQLDGEDVKVNGKYNVKILFLVPKKHINIFSDELLRTIDFISKYEEIELILVSNESHLPKIPVHIANRKNIRQYYIAEKYSTSKLIDWADIVMHAGTGIIFESFVKEKITVLPRYLSANTLISDKYGAGFNLSNRDELRALLNASVISLDNLKNIYKEKCELLDKKFIDEFVYANTESVPQNIIETISLISDNFKTSKR
jgi:hypothetical protein